MPDEYEAPGAVSAQIPSGMPPLHQKPSFLHKCYIGLRRRSWPLRQVIHVIRSFTNIYELAESQVIIRCINHLLSGLNNPPGWYSKNDISENQV